MFMIFSWNAISDLAWSAMEINTLLVAYPIEVYPMADMVSSGCLA